MHPCLDGLHCDGIDRARGAHLELVGHHVSQPLVVHCAEEDVGLRCGHALQWERRANRELLARDAAVHALGAVVVVAGAAQLLAKVLEGGHAGVGELERRGVQCNAMQARSLARQELNEHAWWGERGMCAAALHQWSCVTGSRAD